MTHVTSTDIRPPARLHMQRYFAITNREIADQHLAEEAVGCEICPVCRSGLLLLQINMKHISAIRQLLRFNLGPFKVIIHFCRKNQLLTLCMDSCSCSLGGQR